jgi:hypothetical protein
MQLELQVSLGLDLLAMLCVGPIGPLTATLCRWNHTFLYSDLLLPLIDNYPLENPPTINVIYSMWIEYLLCATTCYLSGFSNK